MNDFNEKLPNVSFRMLNCATRANVDTPYDWNARFKENIVTIVLAPTLADGISELD